MEEHKVKLWEIVLAFVVLFAGAAFYFLVQSQKTDETFVEVVIPPHKTEINQSGLGGELYDKNQAGISLPETNTMKNTTVNPYNDVYKNPFE